MFNLSRVRPSPSLSSLVLSLGLGLAGCASSDPAPTTAPPRPLPELVHSHGTDHGRETDHALSYVAWPSSTTAASLPPGTHYRVAVAGPGEIAVTLVGPDMRIRGRLSIHAPHGGLGPLGDDLVLVEHEDEHGLRTQLEAVVRGEHIEGRARTDAGQASWRVRHEANGHIAGLRWSPRARAESPGLRAAAGITRDLALSTTPLRLAGSDPDADPCALAELLALSKLALELSVRAWEGRGRSELSLDFTPTGC